MHAMSVSGLDLDGESSRVTVRSNINIRSDGILTMNFKVIWGESEFHESDIYRPKAYPPVLPWTDLSWENLSTMITPIATIEYLFDSILPGGKTLVDSERHFIETVLDIDASYDITSVKPRILSEFETIEVRVEIEPSKSAYTIAPLKFLSKIDFHGFPPVGEIKIETGSSIDLQTSSFALNHFLFPEGHRFESEALFGFRSSYVTYDTSGDAIHVRKLPPVISSTLLYSLWIGAAFLSLVMVTVAARRAKKNVNKGVEMWFGIGMVCFFAFLPFHLYLSLLMIILGFYHSVKKSQSLKPVSSRKPSSEQADQPSSESGSGPVASTPESGNTQNKGMDREKPLRPEDLKAFIPPELPLSRTTIPHSDTSFAPPTSGIQSKPGSPPGQPFSPNEDHSIYSNKTPPPK